MAAHVALCGVVGGRLVRRDGSVRDFTPSPNLICFGALDLVGALLCRRPNLRGVTWLAVGRGDPSWATTPPLLARSRTALTAEVARVRLVPGQHISYAGGRVRIRITLGPRFAT
ncbi:MAG: hypothetical protein ACRD12_02810, partial [Acidimicrobiales bacterium]